MIRLQFCQGIFPSICVILLIEIATRWWRSQHVGTDQFVEISETLPINYWSSHARLSVPVTRRRTVCSSHLWIAHLSLIVIAYDTSSYLKTSSKTRCDHQFSSLSVSRVIFPFCFFFLFLPFSVVIVPMMETSILATDSVACWRRHVLTYLSDHVSYSVEHLMRIELSFFVISLSSSRRTRRSFTSRRGICPKSSDEKK